MKYMMSEDFMRRAFLNAEGTACEAWRRKYLRKTHESCIIDIDMQVKPLYLLYLRLVMDAVAHTTPTDRCMR
jgi:hypothetical protein